MHIFVHTRPNDTQHYVHSSQKHPNLISRHKFENACKKYPNDETPKRHVGQHENYLIAQIDVSVLCIARMKLHKWKVAMDAFLSRIKNRLCEDSSTYDALSPLRSRLFTFSRSTLCVFVESSECSEPWTIIEVRFSIVQNVFGRSVPFSIVFFAMSESRMNE